MRYTTFNQVKNDQLLEPIFFGNPVNVARYDQQRHSILEKLTEKQLSFFWRPEEIDVSKDKRDFANLSPGEQHIFVSNLQYQILLDSVQGRSPNVAFLPIVSLPEAETFIETWSFFETIHSRSYTHIVSAVFNDASPIFDGIIDNKAIRARAQDVSVYYDELIQATQAFQYLGEGEHCVDNQQITASKRGLKQKLYLCMCSVNALEAIRFYVSFACTFAFSENKLMTGAAKIMRLISRDEAVHLSFTQHVLNLWRLGKDDPEMAEIAFELKQQAIDIFITAVNQEKQWATYLFKNGSMMGLNATILCQYIEFIANQRMSVLGFEKPFAQRSNPIPWINHYLSSDAVQDAPQEIEITSYLMSQVNTEVHMTDFAEIEL